MKTRYKITLVVGLFALFYITVPLFTQHCYEISDDCEIFSYLMNQTRAGIVSQPGEGITEWSGTTDGKEKTAWIDQLRANIQFIQTMIIPPIIIITAIILWDKRK